MARRAIHVGLSLMREDDFRRAALPLFEMGAVDAVEWSFDVPWNDGEAPTGFARPAVAEWLDALLAHYAGAGRLYGHGVHFSPLSACWERRQEEWITRAQRECRARRYRHVSEHFGFMTTPGFARGAPLPVPWCEAALSVGRDRLRRLSDACGAPVGLENLAFAFSERDARDQGTFLEELLAPVGGFLVLDLHNLYCQLQNFAVGADELLRTYPLNRVREMHVSGGSWSETTAGRFRRDTHDDDVPSAVLELLGQAIPRCPNLEVVFVERLGGTIDRPAPAPRGLDRAPSGDAKDSRNQEEGFRDDFLAVRKVVADHQAGEPATNTSPDDGASVSATRRLTDAGDARPPFSATEADLAGYQRVLLEGLAGGASFDGLRARLAAEPGCRPFHDYVNDLSLRSFEVAGSLWRKWGVRADAAL